MTSTNDKKLLPSSITSSSQVFGAAPSLSTMRNMKGKFKWVIFWYYFRLVIPYLFPILFLILMIVSLTSWRTVEGNLVLGSVLSLFMSLSVLSSYLMIVPWRKHPSALVLYKSLTSTLFSVNILFEAISTSSNAANRDSCRYFAVVTHFALLAGECWLTTIALDLVYSLTNPFVSYKSNLKRYQVLVWTFTGLISFIFYFDRSCQGSFDQGICWVKFTSTTSPCLWGYYLFWMICMYAFQIWASVYAYLRLRKGLPLTFEIRKKCAEETFKCLMAYATYLSILIFMFSIISSDPTAKPGSTMANFSLFFLFMIANRGSVDGIVWFMLHDFAKESKPNPDPFAHELSEEQMRHQAEALKEEPFSAAYAASRVASFFRRRQFNEMIDDIESYDDKQPLNVPSHEKMMDSKEKKKMDDEHHTGFEAQSHRILQEVEVAGEKLTKNMTKAITKLADLAIAEYDEADLSPQVNMALRQQIVQYVTLGVKNAVRKVGIGHTLSRDIKDIMDNVFRPKDPASIDGLPELEFLLEDEHPFKAFAPELFRELRYNEGIDDERYLKVLSASANERLSEGASGAFMFFCGGGEFIVKTIRSREAKVLHTSLRTYSRYLRTNPDSLLCRFLGSYSLSMYSQTFYFVVMLNCFDPKAYINERFDIKGSWVSRSAEPPKKTKKVVCRHCNSYFRPIMNEDCKAIVGKHEANVVLKDNDLRVKISLHPDDARRVLDILKRDSDLLGKLGVLDYSLLLGIKKWKFDVEVTQEMLDFKPSNLSKIDDKGERKDDPQKIKNSSKSCFEAKTVTGPAVYHLGIVDFLQDWSLRKRAERALKIYLLRKDPDGLSVMEPEDYKLRFQNKMEQIFDQTGKSGGVGLYEMQHLSLIPIKKAETNPVLKSSDDGLSSIEMNEISNVTIPRGSIRNTKSPEPIINPLMVRTNSQVRRKSRSNSYTSINNTSGSTELSIGIDQSVDNITTNLENAKQIDGTVALDSNRQQNTTKNIKSHEQMIRVIPHDDYVKVNAEDEFDV